MTIIVILIVLADVLLATQFPYANDVGSMTHTVGFKFPGLTGSFTGYSVKSIRDIDGDNTNDFAI